MLLRVPSNYEVVLVEDVKRGDILLRQDRMPFYVKAAYPMENDVAYVFGDAEGTVVTAVKGEQLMRHKHARS
jgi:hypothetical protein